MRNVNRYGLVINILGEVLHCSQLLLSSDEKTKVSSADTSSAWLRSEELLPEELGVPSFASECVIGHMHTTHRLSPATRWLVLLLSAARLVPSAATALLPPSSPPPLAPAVNIPAGGVAILDGDALFGVNFNESSILFCVYPGDEAVTDPTQLGIPIAPKTKTLIAGQCCTNTQPQECRRRPTPSGSECTDEEMASGACNEYCVAGTSDSVGDITPMTFGEISSYCISLGLGLCRQSCRLTGCQYDGHPVWTDVPCPFAAPPPSPPALPPMLHIPTDGLGIYNGGDETGQGPIACLWPGEGGTTEVPSSSIFPGSTAPEFSIIAAQCCVTGLPDAPETDCRRTTGGHVNDVCRRSLLRLGGHFS